jgi:hypothetical protein
MKKFSILTIITALITLELNAKNLVKQDIDTIMDSKKTNKIQPRYQGVILEVLDANKYTYLKIDEKTPGYDPKKLKSFWIAVNRSSARVGDNVRFKKELVTKMYKSKKLNKNFNELFFASELEYRVSK